MTVRNTFAKYDVDQSGTLDVRELRGALKMLGMSASSEETIAIMNKYDKSEDGKLDLPEFNALVTELQAFLETQPQRSTTAAPVRAGRRPAASATATARSSTPVNVSSKAEKDDEYSKLMKEADISSVFDQYRVAISELFDFYASSSATSGGSRISAEQALKLLRDFKLCPAKISEFDARNAIRQLGDKAVNRKEFNELLLRFSKGAAERDPGLRSAPPKRKLHALIADLAVSDLNVLRDNLTRFSRDPSAPGTGAASYSATTTTKPSKAKKADDKAQEKLAIKLQSVQRGKKARESAPGATRDAMKKLKPIEITVHDVRFSAAGAEMLTDIKAFQIGVILGDDKATRQEHTASYGMKSFGSEGPEPITAEWTARVGLGKKSAGFEVLSKAMYKPPQPPDAIDVGRKGEEPTASVRDAFDAADRNRSGTLDQRELSTALKQLGLEASSEETAAILQKYDKDQSGQLELGEFTVLVQELHAFQSSLLEKDFLSMAPVLPLKVVLYNARASAATVAMSGMQEIATSEINIAQGKDVKYAEVPIRSAEDGGILGFITVTLKAAASVRPFLNVRSTFVRMDTDGDGSITLDEVLPALRSIGVVTDEYAINAFNRANETNDGKLTLSEFDKLYRAIGGFDEAAERTSPIQKYGGDPYSVSSTQIAARSAYYESEKQSAAMADPSTAVLFSKVVPLKALEPEHPYSFWVDAHCRLEILEISLINDPNVRHSVVMTARGADGQTKVQQAVIFDSGAYFNLEPQGNKSTTTVKGGPSWSFPGPAMYELQLGRSGGSNPPLPLKMRMVSRFEEAERMDDYEARTHPLITNPRKAPPQVFASSTSHAPPYTGPSATMPTTSMPTTSAMRPYQPSVSVAGPPATTAGGISSSYSTQYSAGTGTGGTYRPPVVNEPTSLGAYGASRSAAVSADPHLSSSAVRSQPPTAYIGAPTAASKGPPTAAKISSITGTGIGPATLDAAFEKFDRDGRGYLSMKDVAAALRSLGLEVTPKTLANFADADTDGDGALRLTEFKGLVASLEQTKAGPDSGDGKGAKATLSAAELMEAKVIFTKYDKTKNGYMSSRELVPALKELHLPTETTQAVQILSQFDANSDGRLDLPEFALLLRKIRGLQGLDPSSTSASLRAAFRAYDSRGVGSISVADVRPALMRAGIDTSSGVAVAIFGSLQDQPRTTLDFAQFQRIAHAITSSGSAVPGPVVGSGNSLIGSSRPGSAPTRSTAMPTTKSPTQAPVKSAYPPVGEVGGDMPYPNPYPPGYQPTGLGNSGPGFVPLGSAYGSPAKMTGPPSSMVAGNGKYGATPPSKEDTRRMARNPTAVAGGARRKL